MTTKKDRLTAAFVRLRALALSYPETREDLPWGESAFKVRGKTFIFARVSEEGLHISVKLPTMREFALEYPFTKPTPYGLGKSGWVSAEFAGTAAIPFDLIEAWVAESYRAIAPRKLLMVLEAQSGPRHTNPAKKKTSKSRK